MVRSSRACSFRALGLATVASVWLLRGADLVARHVFASLASRGRGSIIARGGIFEGAPDFSTLQKTLSDPKKQEEMTKLAEDIMADPEKAKAMEEYNKQMEARVAKLRADPEMKEFFEDIDKNGMEAIKNWEQNEEILLKFSQAMGGAPGGVPGEAPGGAPPAGASLAFKPGMEVIIKELKAKPELNGKKAMVVPPTQEEQKTLEGTGRVIVRLLDDSGAQFAVKPSNLQSTSQAANAAMASGLENISPQDPAVQAEAARLRESGMLEALQKDPELKPIFEDIKKNGMSALEKYWNDEEKMAKISKAMGAA